MIFFFRPRYRCGHVFGAILSLHLISLADGWMSKCPNYGSFCYFSFPLGNLSLPCLQAAQQFCAAIVPQSFPIQNTERGSKRVLKEFLNNTNNSIVILNAIAVERQQWKWVNGGHSYDDMGYYDKTCDEVNLFKGKGVFQVHCVPITGFEVVCSLECPFDWVLQEEKKMESEFLSFPKISLENCKKRCIEEAERCHGIAFRLDHYADANGKVIEEGPCMLYSKPLNEKTIDSETYDLYILDRYSRDDCLKGKLVSGTNVSFTYTCDKVKSPFIILVFMNILFTIVYVIIVVNWVIISERSRDLLDESEKKSNNLMIDENEEEIENEAKDTHE